jgi:hypothetical protein
MSPIPAPTSVFDAIWFTTLSLCTIGAISALILVGIIVVYNLELTPLDATILVWMIVAFCISAVVLASALYLTCCDLKYGKLVLAALYAIFDGFVLLVAIAILTLRPSILNEIGKVWADDSQSAIVVYLEEQFNCCGFDRAPSHDCKGRTSNCRAVVDEQLVKYSAVIAGVSIAVFVVLLAGVVVSCVRALRPSVVVADESKTEEISHLNEKLTADAQFWF